MKHSFTHAIGAICAAALAAVSTSAARAPDDQQALLRVDRAAFEQGNLSAAARGDVFDSNFTWTDTSGHVRTKSQVLQNSNPWKDSTPDAASGRDTGARASSSATAHVYGQVGIVQENSGSTYILRVWLKRPEGWRAFVYQAVAVGSPPASVERAPLRGSGPASGGRTRQEDEGECQNPCETVPFESRTANEREVIQAYQAVERAVTAHNSPEWGAHIAEEFFAVTSNSDRPLDKATRMAGLDNQKVGGIAPFPLVSARMFEFGDAMVMISRQQPERGLPLHVTRVWFKRNGKWLEAYSYQTTIQPASPQ